MRRLRDLQERTGKSSSAAQIASDIEDLVEKAYQATRSLYQEGVTDDVKAAAHNLENVLGRVAREEVVQLLRAAQE